LKNVDNFLTISYVVKVKVRKPSGDLNVILTARGKGEIGISCLTDQSSVVAGIAYLFPVDIIEVARISVGRNGKFVKSTAERCIDLDAERNRNDSRRGINNTDRREDHEGRVFFYISERASRRLTLLNTIERIIHIIHAIPIIPILHAIHAIPSMRILLVTLQKAPSGVGVWRFAQSTRSPFMYPPGASNELSET